MILLVFINAALPFLLQDSVADVDGVGIALGLHVVEAQLVANRGVRLGDKFLRIFLQGGMKYDFCTHKHSDWEFHISLV